MSQLNLHEVLTITFDSNVWENIVDPSKRHEDEIYIKIYDAIHSNKIEPFFFEGLAILETIPKDKRKNYIGNFKPSYKIQIEDEVVTQQGTLPYDLSDYLKNNLPLALELGFKFIRIPRNGLPSVDQKYMSTLGDANMKERQDRSFECAHFIENELGAGYQYLKNTLNMTGNQHLIHKTYSDEVLSDKKFAIGVAEWVDGDALSAHYGYGIKYFCTNDNARGAGSNSVFSIENRRKLKDKFGINIISPIKLIELM